MICTDHVDWCLFSLSFKVLLHLFSFLGGKQHLVHERWKPCSLPLVYECLQSLSGLYSRVAANVLTVNAVWSVLACVL